MRLSERMRKLLIRKDYEGVGALVEHMRSDWNMTYKDIADWVQLHCGVGLSEWQSILQECESVKEK